MITFNYFLDDFSDITPGTFFTVDLHPYDIIYYLYKINTINNDIIYYCLCLGELSDDISCCEFINIDKRSLKPVDISSEYIPLLTDYIIESRF